MKTGYGFLVVFVLSLVTTAVASDYQYVDREVTRSETFGDRFRAAVLPGFNKSRDTYGRTNLAPQEEKYERGFDSSNSFQAAFTDGRSRQYVDNADTSFAVDPATPTGNVFDFRF